jgi:hypothetical protein
LAGEGVRARRRVDLSAKMLAKTDFRLISAAFLPPPLFTFAFSGRRGLPTAVGVGREGQGLIAVAEAEAASAWLLNQAYDRSSWNAVVVI